MAVVLMKGNEAIAEAAIIAGCRYYFGYPITPQNEIPAYMSLRMPKVGGTFLQAESEIAAINMVFGACRGRCPCHDLVLLARHQPQDGGDLLHGRRGAARRGGQHDAGRSRPGQHRRCAGRLLPGGEGRRTR